MANFLQGCQIIAQALAEEEVEEFARWFQSCPLKHETDIEGKGCTDSNFNCCWQLSVPLARLMLWLHLTGSTLRRICTLVNEAPMSDVWMEVETSHVDVTNFDLYSEFREGDYTGDADEAVPQGLGGEGAFKRGDGNVWTEIQASLALAQEAFKLAALAAASSKVGGATSQAVALAYRDGAARLNEDTAMVSRQLLAEEEAAAKEEEDVTLLSPWSHQANLR